MRKFLTSSVLFTKDAKVGSKKKQKNKTHLSMKLALKLVNIAPRPLEPGRSIGNRDGFRGRSEGGGCTSPTLPIPTKY